MINKKMKFISLCAKYGGKWSVVHAGGDAQSDPLTGYYVTESEAEAARTALLATYRIGSPAFTEELLRVVQQATLAEVRAHCRRIKHYSRFNVEVFRVCRKTHKLVDGKLVAGETESLSPWYGSKFTALKALRKIRKVHPTARLMRETLYFGEDDLAKRAVFMCLIINAGERL